MQLQLNNCNNSWYHSILIIAFGISLGYYMYSLLLVSNCVHMYTRNCVFKPGARRPVAAARLVS